MATVEIDKMSVTSDGQTLEQMHAALGMDPPVTEPPQKKEEASKKEPEQKRAANGTFAAESDKKNRRHDPRAAVEAAVAKQREAERRAEAAEKREKEREAELAAARAARVEPPAQERPVERPAERKETPAQAWRRYVTMPEAPQRAEYPDEGEYAAALQVHVAEQRFKELRAVERAEEQREVQRYTEIERGRAFADRLKEAKTRHPDFDSRDWKSVPVNVPTQEYIKDSPLGPDVLVYLADHPDDAQRISALPPLQSREAIAEIAGLVKAHLAAAEPTGPARPMPRSNAKPPIPPVGGSPVGSSAADALDEDLPIEAFIRKGNKAQRRR